MIDYMSQFSAQPDGVSIAVDHAPVLTHEAVVERIVSKYMSLHHMKLIEVGGSFHVACNCKGYMHSGILCCYSLAVLDIEGFFSLGSMTAAVSKPAKPGGVAKTSIVSFWIYMFNDTCIQYMCQIQEHEDIAGALVVFTVMHNQ